MNKSTPLSQLPNTQQQPTLPNNPTFVNDQQRQIFVQAQQAAQTFTLPQNTQASNDMGTEDDMTIQDALDALNASASGGQQQVAQQQAAQAETFQQYQHQQPPSYEQVQQQMYQQESQQYHVADTDAKNKLVNDLMTWNDDVKKSIIIGVGFVLLHMLHIETFIYKYIALDKLPYSAIIIKSVLMFIFTFIVLKWV